MTKILPALVLVLAAALAHAQEGPISYIEVDAEHTVLVPPNYAEFTIAFTASPASADADAAVKAVDEQIKAFRAALNEQDIHPVEIEFSTPTPHALTPPAVVAPAKMKFSLAGFANPDTGPAQFAQLCDALATLAAKAGAPLHGPELGVEDKESAIRNAAAQAVANAYPLGDALALALSARIDAVEAIKVTEVRWASRPAALPPPAASQPEPVNAPAPGAPPALEPNLRQLACTVKVHVTYAARPAAP